MPYDLSKMRQIVKEKLGRRPQDPNEFKPAKAQGEELIKYRFYVLGPLLAGQKCFGGVASKDMDIFCIKHGSHWINQRPYACPRVNRDEPCELCEAGFDLLKQTQDKDKRTAIVKAWLSQSVFTVNVYFPNADPNPPQLRDKVLYFHAPKTCSDQWFAAINSDTGGDVLDPQAYGVFFDENASFLYQLEVKKDGNNNSYKTSKFLAKAGAHPIAMNKDRTPNTAKIQLILDSRHDLFSKIEQPDPDKIHKLANKMLHGVDDGDVDDDVDVGQLAEGTTLANEIPAQAPPASKPAAAPKPAAPKATAPANNSVTAVKPATPAPPPPTAPAAPVTATPAPVATAAAAAAATGDDPEIDSLLAMLANE